MSSKHLLDEAYDETFDQTVNLKNLNGKVLYKKLKYKIYRKETRIDSIFGFKSWDSEYADNYSTLGNEDNEDKDPSLTRCLQCTICLENFKGDDSIIQLNCHYKHIFHENCIEDWII
jgi:hypothetical protein